MLLDKYLICEVSPGLDKIEALANVLGTTPPHLLTDTSHPVEIHPEIALKTAVEYLKSLARKHGYAWPPSIEFFAMLVKFAERGQ